jgi:uncharacterized repeat protein (TIGR02543 family)
LAIGGEPFDAFSFQYSPMTDAEVFAKLDAAPRAPEGGGILSQLSGKTYKITSEPSLTLELTFDAQSADVSVSAQLPPIFGATEPTQLEFTSEYAGLASGDFVLVGFREPDTAKAWAVVLNLKNGLAAAYEVFFKETPSEWFGLTPARETQRNVYIGKIEGVGSSVKLPSATNRLTGKAVLWENDLGRFYTNYGTNSWSAFYPLGQPEGLAGSWTAPSDYLDFHDARHFLYSRTESYYSGATLVELLDLHLVSQIGLKIGFDADDTLEFKLYRGDGKILGSYAAYGGFAASEAVGNPAFRWGYRPSSEKLTEEEVIEAIEVEGSWTNAFGGPGKEERMYPLSDKLNGEAFSLVFDDGLTLEYQFTDVNDLKFREAGAQDWKTGRYEAFEVDANLIFFTHAIDDKFPDKIYLNVVDFDNGLATCMNSEILVDEATPRMCIPTFHFGVLNKSGITPVSERHGFSKGLLGRSFTWTYNDTMVSQHYYATPDSLYYAIMGESGDAFLMWSCDAWYVKFRENVYLISWLESFGSGQNDSKIFNLNTMHDAGVCYGIPDGGPFEYNTYGSEARHAGTVDVSSIYGKESQPEQSYTVRYELNGGTGSSVTDSTLYSPGASVVVKGIGNATRSGYTFAGWNTAANGTGVAYQPGVSFTINRNTPLYAQWTRVNNNNSSSSAGSGSGGGGGSVVTHQVTFDSQGGSAVAAQTVTSGRAAVSPTNPTRAGYVFGGWYTDAAVTSAYSFTTLVTAPITLYAKWAEDDGTGAAETPAEIPVTSTLNETPFSDVVGHWGYGDIEYAYKAGWMNGASANQFAPNVQIERGMIVTALWRIEGSPAPTAPASFNDVEANAYYAQAVAWAAEHNVVNGVGDGLFAPLRQVTREQVATILYRYAQYKQYDVSAQGDLSKLPDASAISGYEDARASVAWAVGAELLRGRDSGVLDPLGTATRAEMAALLHRFHLAFAAPAAPAEGE